METRSVYDFLNPGLYEMPDCVGLDYESAVDAMPRLYGVSFGNGNDGVSHTFARFYVRTCEPYILAAAAVLSEFNAGAGQEFAAVNMEIEGEAEYGISAMILNPHNDRAEYDSDMTAAQECVDIARENLCECEAYGTPGQIEDAREELNDAEHALDALENNDPGSWCDANGAWFICEVFPEDDDPRRGVQVYTSLDDAFSADIVTAARNV